MKIYIELLCPETSALAQALQIRGPESFWIRIMASVKTIIEQIEGSANGVYKEWTIGLTKVPLLRKAQLGNPLCWLHWQTASYKDAKEVVNSFVMKGMHQDLQTEGGTFVYILLAEVQDPKRGGGSLHGKHKD